MSEPGALAEQFEEHRAHLRTVAYNLLGSVSEAEDAVQECWLRLHRTDAETIVTLRGWLTAVVGRICIDMLRARQARKVDYVGPWLPEPLVEEPVEQGPSAQAELVDTLSLALLIVLENLNPAERLAFVLHDVFAVPFEEIAVITERTPAAARQLASRARRRIQAAPRPDRDPTVQRRVVEAFLTAARTGDFEALFTVLAPDVVLRFDVAPASHPTLVGSDAVVAHVLATAERYVAMASVVLVNGDVGLLFGSRADPVSVLGFTIVDGRIAALDLLAAQAKLRHLSIDPESEI